MLKLTMIVIFIVTFASLLPAGSAQQSSAIFEAYSKIGAALSQDQLSDAVKHAKELQNAISAADHQKVKEELMPAVDGLVAAKNLDDARKSFEQLSTRLSAIQKDLGIHADEYYCSMVKKSWLQKDTKIMNPYAGKEMASCGEKKKKT